MGPRITEGLRSRGSRASQRASDTRVHLGGQAITRLELLRALEGSGAMKGGQPYGPPSVCTHSSPTVCDKIRR